MSLSGGCGLSQPNGNDANSLVSDKWSYAEQLAQTSVQQANEALNAITQSATSEIASAGQLNLNISNSGGGNISVEYSIPEQPEPPELGLEPVNKITVAYGGAPDYPIWDGLTSPPTFSGRPPGGGTGINWQFNDVISDFSGQAPQTPNIQFDAPSLTTINVPVYTPPSLPSIQVPTEPDSPGGVTLPGAPVFEEVSPPSEFSGRFNVPPVTVSVPSAPVSPQVNYTLPDITVRIDAPPPKSYGTPPTISLPSRPVLSAGAPDDAPQVEYPEYPTAPKLTTPADPQRYQIPLPTLRVPDLSGIDGLLNELHSGKPDEPELSVPQDGVLGVFDQLRNGLSGEIEKVLPIEEVLTWMLSGDTIGIPANVAQMLRDRAFAAEDKLAFQAESEAIGDWLSRGFTLPGGALAAQLADVRQKNRDKKAELNRNLWIEEAKMEIENLRFAISEGIKYQGMLWDNKIKLWSLCGDLAAKFIDVQLKVLDSVVAVYKANLDAWQTEAQVYKDYINALLQAELGKLEITKTEAEISKVFVSLNQLEVELYKAGLEGAVTEVNLYKAQIDAANGKLQAEALKIEAFAKSVQVYAASVQAYEAEWRGYASAIQGETAQIEAFKATVQAYGIEVDAYGKSVDAERTRATTEAELARLGMDAEKTKLALYDAEVNAYGKQVEAERTRVTAETEVARLGLEAHKTEAQTYGVSADIYGKQIEAAKAKLMSEIEVAKFGLDTYKTEAQIYGTRVDVYGKQVEAERTRVTAETEIAKLNAEAHRTQVAVYSAQADIYGKQVDAERSRVMAQIEAAKLPLEAYKAEAQAYSAKADAYGKRAQAEAARVQGEVEVAKLPIEIYKSETQAYSAEVDAYGKLIQAKRDEATTKVEVEKLKLEAFRNELEAYKAELQKAATEMDAKSKVHGAHVQLFSSLVESEKARVTAKLQNVDQALRQTQFEASVELKKAELEQAKVLELAKIALSADQEVARVAAQLAGAALSAVNASASIGNSYSAGVTVSSGCSESYNYDMSY